MSFERVADLDATEPTVIAVVRPNGSDTVVEHQTDQMRSTIPAERIGDASAMTSRPDPRVEAYIEALPDWQQTICREVRALVHAADPDVTETIKRTDHPYFVLQGNICALLAAKDHVNVFLYDGAIVPDPDGIITAGHDNKTARTVAIREGEPINAPALKAMFRQIIANNHAGGWRKLKADRSK
jgi:hypothetical protein